MHWMDRTAPSKGGTIPSKMVYTPIANIIQTDSMASFPVTPRGYQKTHCSSRRRCQARVAVLSNQQTLYLRRMGTTKLTCRHFIQRDSAMSEWGALSANCPFLNIAIYTSYFTCIDMGNWA